MGGLIGAWGLSAGLLVGGGAGFVGTVGIHTILLRRRRRSEPRSLGTDEVAGRR
jgi:hypothetical protein